MPKYRNDLTAERVRELLSYDPDTGVFRWKIKTNPRVQVGDIAGREGSKGYRKISIGNCKYFSHRLAWLHFYGCWPTDQIDHRNGVKADNWIKNLREATNTQNNQNRKGRSDSRAKMIGATWNEKNKNWTSHICASGKRTFLGVFDSPEKASEAYASAKKLLHTFQPTIR